MLDDAGYSISLNNIITMKYIVMYASVTSTAQSTS
jgi:hypothetical protein